MKIEKTVYGRLPSPYSMLVCTYRGKRLCLCASEEKDGDILITETDTGIARRIVSLPGGIMSILPVPEREGVFLAITRFFPVFLSKEAEIVCFELCEPEGEIWPVKARTIAKLPFVHRISVSKTRNGYALIGATLCRDKAFTQDWSQPGSVYRYLLSPELEVLKKEELLSEQTKNHGMFSTNGKVYTASQDGVWELDTQSGAVQKTLDEPVSDLMLYDTDGDGRQEIVCIAPFHGDSLCIFKEEGDGWKCVFNKDIQFGHALWCGRCGKDDCVIVSSRGGEKNIELIRFCGGKAVSEILDSGVGAANLDAEPFENGLVLYSANHGCGEVAAYRIEADE